MGINFRADRLYSSINLLYSVGHLIIPITPKRPIVFPKDGTFTIFVSSTRMVSRLGFTFVNPVDRNGEGDESARKILT